MRKYPVYLNGRFLLGDSFVPVTNPATGDAFAEMTLMSRAQVAQAITDAHSAFTYWRTQTGKQRGEWLRRIADELERRAEEVARLITQENGKPIEQSRTEVAMSVDHLHWFGEEAKRTYGRIIPNATDGKRNLVIKSPIGVVGAISPWNFPLMLAVRKVAPALAAACPVLLKPARQAPLCAVAFSECVDAVGLPPGVFQLVQGDAAQIGQEFLANSLCRKITFTGSTEVGQELIRGAAKLVKPLSLELGGQAPCLVFDDAPLDKAVEGVIAAKFRNTGQSCIAANRIYVQQTIYAEFLERLKKRVEGLKVGNGLEEGMDIGPLIDGNAVEKAVRHVNDALKRGARLTHGGSTLPGRKGFFFQPTLLADVPGDALCSYEETFAPILPVSAFATENDAITLANASNFGLSAYAFTSDLSRTFRLMESLEAGTIGINDGVPTASQAPFGGMKMSGWGRELGVEGIEAFLETKHVSLGLS